MNQAAVVIGVDRTGQMPVLRGAASGAAEFAAWARSQAFDVTLLTDADGGCVALADVKRAVSAFVDPGTCEKLLVFFSGHGMLTGPDNEVWLLSGAPGDTGEAVDVAGSIWLARAAGIPHVLFVSDACRSVPTSLLFEQVKGGDIFPNNLGRRARPAVDVFYASLPGHAALEVRDPAEAAANYRAVFTHCLLKGLRCGSPEVVETVATGSGQEAVIPSYRLKPWLEREVPEEAERISVKLAQDPEIRVESHPPRYFAAAPAPVPGAGADAPPAPAPPPPSAGGSGMREFVETRMLSQFGSGGVGVMGDLREREDEAGFVSEVAAIFAARGRDHFETTTGFTVIGGVPTGALVVGGHCDPPFEGPEGLHIRVNDPGTSRSMLLELEGGTGSVLGVIPGFIGTVHVEDGRVLNVNFTPSRNTGRYEDYEEVAEQLEARRAFVAVAARHGSFRLDPARADSDAGYLRMLKAMDPTLGLYAAYAYAQVGAMEQIASVLHYMMEETESVPFDVALLAERYPPEPGGPLQGRLAPFCPMLTQGWSILATLGDAVPPVLRDVRRWLVPSLWTTFHPAGFREIRARAEAGDLP